MDRTLRVTSVAVVLALAVLPAFDVAAIDHPNRRLFAASVLGLAAVAGVYAAVRRDPIGARATTVIYGIFAIGFGLFATQRSLPILIGYLVALLGMNVLLYHVWAYGPVLAEFREEDAVSRRARGVVLRSLALSGAALVVAYGGSLALLPLFTLDFGLRDPLSALALASGLLATLLFLTLLPDTPLSLWRGRRNVRAR